MCAGYEYFIFVCLCISHCQLCDSSGACDVFVFGTERDPRYRFDDWTLEIANVSRRDGGDYIIECSNSEGKYRTKLKLDVQCKELL